MDFRDVSHSSFDHEYVDIETGRPNNVAPETKNLILSTLPEEMLKLLRPALKPVLLTKEQFLYQEEDRLEFIYFPETAVVSEFKILEDGRMVEIAVTGKEGAVGLSSMFSNSHFAPNCTQVSQAGTARRIDTEAFDKLLRSNEKVRTSLSHFVDIYIRQISQKAICNMYHSVRERLCTWLLMVQDRCGQRILNLTHEQIARTLGVYRPSITCIAQELRDGNLISYSRGGITIRDRRRVEQSACSCYMEIGFAAPTF
ncbi:MAG: Crp/Fnr family transcriptional regulator [Chloracidobacterium sp.]|nr:Crp/Fnr family transcriptional regulator [Chloracidobacterium sp.]